MFTGLVQGKGVIKGVTKKGGALGLEVSCPFSLADVTIGESIAVNGVCLTVESKGTSAFEVFVSAETLLKTNLSALKISDEVNLERALRWGDRLGGHLVTGHIDTIGKVIALRQVSGSLLLSVGISQNFSRYIVAKGSVALEGVSLTVNECGEGVFSVNIIPLTARVSTIGDKKIGSSLNIEFDIIGKYLENLSSAFLNRNEKIDVNFLTRHGFA